MSSEDRPEFPDGLSSEGSLPGDKPQPTPNELELSRNHLSEEDQRLNGFIDFDEVTGLNRSQKVKLVQNISKRFVFSYLNGMNATIGFSDTLRPEIINTDLVAKYKHIVSVLWGGGIQLPHQMDGKMLETLINIGSTDHEGNRSFFVNIIRPPKHEPNPKNLYLSEEEFIYHDARMLDYLIKELYLDPSKHVIGFSKN